MRHVVVLVLLSFVVGCSADQIDGGAAPPGGLFGGAGSGGDGDGDSDVAAPSDPSGGEVGGEGGEPIGAGTLTAAEWNDLASWDFWLSLVDTDDQGAGGPLATYAEQWQLDVLDRVAVVVTDAEGAFVQDARAELFVDGQSVFVARTDVHGRAELFADFEPDSSGADDAPLKLVVDKGAASATVADLALTGAGEPVAVVLDGASAGPAGALDLMFVVDTTGSMGDELAYLQTELDDVISRVSGHDDGTSIRLSMNFYRDEGDAYVIHSNDFTSDLAAARATLLAESADGGGDWPEALDVALMDAVDHDWRETPATRLLFVVLDAPAHHTSAVVEDIREAVSSAAAQGIRIVPVASSGVDRALETFLRQAAILTGGTYVFITDDSGVGNDHLEPVVGEIQVEPLNDLLVRLIVDALG